LPEVVAAVQQEVLAEAGPVDTVSFPHNLLPLGLQ
jgi:hypothetical protein